MHRPRSTCDVAFYGAGIVLDVHLARVHNRAIKAIPRFWNGASSRLPRADSRKSQSSVHTFGGLRHEETEPELSLTLLCRRTFHRRSDAREITGMGTRRPHHS